MGARREGAEPVDHYARGHCRRHAVVAGWSGFHPQAVNMATLEWHWETDTLALPMARLILTTQTQTKVVLYVEGSVDRERQDAGFRHAATSCQPGFPYDVEWAVTARDGPPFQAHLKFNTDVSRKDVQDAALGLIRAHRDAVVAYTSLLDGA